MKGGNTMGETIIKMFDKALERPFSTILIMSVAGKIAVDALSELKGLIPKPLIKIETGKKNKKESE